MLKPGLLGGRCLVAALPPLCFFILIPLSLGPETHSHSERIKTWVGHIYFPAIPTEVGKGKAGGRDPSERPAEGIISHLSE